MLTGMVQWRRWGRPQTSDEPKIVERWMDIEAPLTDFVNFLVKEQFHPLLVAQ